MHFTTLLALAGAACARDIRIDVGKDGNVFTPDNVQAAMGDMLDFHFWPMNHSVVAGDPTNPCNPVTQGGFFSGFIQTQQDENPMVFHARVNTTEPMFFYSSADDNCKQGMVGVVNQRNDMTLDMYKQRAAGVDWANSPQEAYGGVLTNNNVPQGCPTGTLVPAPTDTGYVEPGSNNPVDPNQPPQNGQPPAEAGAASYKGSVTFALLSALGASFVML